VTGEQDQDAAELRRQAAEVRAAIVAARLRRAHRLGRLARVTLAAGALCLLVAFGSWLLGAWASTDAVYRITMLGATTLLIGGLLTRSLANAVAARTAPRARARPTPEARNGAEGPQSN
jgi:hypothetical protein